MLWKCKTFDELTLQEFHNILQLRINVFIVEQNCPYSELDNKDKLAYHLFAFSEEKPQEIIAYSRIFKPGDYYQEAAFGRVAVHSKYRKQKLGYQLVKKTVEKIDILFNNPTIKIGAQIYLKEFYKYFNFKQIEEEYIEDGIPHISMIRN